MMEAPPTADVMGGKDRAARSRSDSGGSSRLSARGVPLSREVSQRIMAQKLRSGETLPLPSPGLSRASTAISDHQPTGQRHDRLTEQIDFAFPYDSPKKRKPSPIRIQVSEDSSDSAVTVLRDTAQAVQKPEARRVASRPQLSTIKSDSLLPSDTEEDFSTPAETPKENSLPYLRHSDDGSSSEARDRISRRSPLLLQGDSVHGLDGFAPPKAAMSSQDLRKDFRRELYEDFPQFRTARHGSQDSMEEAGGAELFDSWYTPDFELPEWILEHTKREVKQRWSMDI